MTTKADTPDFFTMRQARDVIEDCVLHPLHHSNRTVYLEGPPGIGKTAMAHAIFKKHERSRDRPNGFTHFVHYVAPEREATEWGLPMPNADRTAIYMMPLSEFIWPAGSRVFFFVDEIDKANNMMQNVLARMAHEQRVYNVVLPPGSTVVMAGNRLTDRAGGFSANTHIKNRRTYVPVGVDYKEWIDDVGIPFDLHPSVVSQIRTEPGMLHIFDPAAPAFPSPRSWTKVGEALNTLKPEHVERALVEGDLGRETANAFWGHLAIYRKLRPAEEIIANPTKVPIPKGADAMAVTWAEVTALARHADAKTADPIFRYFQRLPQEYAFVGFKDVMLRKGGRMIVAASKIGQDWMIENGDLILSTE